MPRPCVYRKVYELPRSACFKPRGIPLSGLEQVNLGLDELEAVRMADLDGLYHEEAAEKMGISRQTFGNIIESARKKIADALVNSKAIVMEGGQITVIAREFTCRACAHVWSLSCGESCPEICPNCGSKDIYRNNRLSDVPNGSRHQACKKKSRRCVQ
jgi:uncharacterized protein